MTRIDLQPQPAKLHKARSIQLSLGVHSVLIIVKVMPTNYRRILGFEFYCRFGSPRFVVAFIFPTSTRRTMPS